MASSEHRTILSLATSGLTPIHSNFLGLSDPCEFAVSNPSRTSTKTASKTMNEPVLLHHRAVTRGSLSSRMYHLCLVIENYCPPPSHSTPVFVYRSSTDAIQDVNCSVLRQDVNSSALSLHVLARIIREICVFYLLNHFVSFWLP